MIAASLRNCLALLCLNVLPTQGQVAIGSSVRTLFEVGTVDGRGSLSQIGAIAAAAKSGFFFVAQPVDASVVVVARGGTIERRFGRRGRGPGEFVGLQSLGFVGDTLWALDRPAGRVSFFSSSGDYIDGWPFAVGPGSTAVPLGVLRDHRLLQASQSLEGKHNLLLKTTRSGVLLMTVDSVRRRAADVIRYASRELTFSLVSPFDARPLVSLASNGEYFAFVERPVATDANSASFRVKLFDASGRPLYDRHIKYSPRGIDGRLKGRTVDDMLSRYESLPGGPGGGGGIGPIVRRVLADSMRFPRWQPPVYAILVTNTGGIWLQREIENGDFGRWDYIDHSGHASRSASLRQDVHFYFAGDDEICGSRDGGMGEPRLVCFAIERSGAPGR